MLLKKPGAFLDSGVEMAEVIGNQREPLRAVIYARVSTEGQAEEEVPITAQIHECQEFISKVGGWSIFSRMEESRVGPTIDLHSNR